MSLMEERHDRDSAVKATIAKVCPDLDEKQRVTATANLERYCEIAADIVAQIESSSDGLTCAESVSTMRERSNVHSKI